MIRIATYVVAIALAIALLAYAGDYAVLRYRVARNQSVYDRVTVVIYYAIQEKGGRTEYASPAEHDETCVNALFPHMGHVPCWYVVRHKEQVIRI